jgi:hypothetical protein
MYLIFSTLKEAEEANNRIRDNMGLSGIGTWAWSAIYEDQNDGGFIIKTPLDKYTTGVALTKYKNKEPFGEIQNYSKCSFVYNKKELAFTRCEVDNIQGD